MKISKPYQYSEKINGTRITFYGNSVDSIVSDVSRIRKKNGVKVPEFNRFYNQIKPKINHTAQVDGVDSVNFKKKTGSNSGYNPTKKSRSVSIKDAAKAASALIKIIPGDYVSESEYQRRLQICASCELKNNNSDCMGCGGSGKAANLMMKFRSALGIGYKTNQKVGGKFCGFCGCSLSLLLLTKIKNYKHESDQVNSERPNYCWLNRNSSNYNNE